MGDFITTVVIVIAIIGTVVFFGIARGILVNESVAIKALETQGFGDVEITKRAWFAVDYRGCSSSDVVKFEAIAINPIGKRVNVFVCAGWPFKGATIRSK